MDLRKIDKLVAIHVMDEKRHQEYSVTNLDISAKSYTIGGGFEYPRYSSDISAAWEVVEKMRSDGVYFEIHPHKSGYEITGYSGYDAMRYSEMDGSAETFQLAICMAALKSKGISTT